MNNSIPGLAPADRGVTGTVFAASGTFDGISSNMTSEEARHAVAEAKGRQEFASKLGAFNH